MTDEQEREDERYRRREMEKFVLVDRWVDEREGGIELYWRREDPQDWYYMRIGGFLPYPFDGDPSRGLLARRIATLRGNWPASPGEELRTLARAEVLGERKLTPEEARTLLDLFDRSNVIAETLRLIAKGLRDAASHEYLGIFGFKMASALGAEALAAKLETLRYGAPSSEPAPSSDGSGLVPES
jgi:hypothetical protein